MTTDAFNGEVEAATIGTLVMARQLGMLERVARDAAAYFLAHLESLAENERLEAVRPSALEIERGVR